MRYTRSAITQLKRQYRSVLLKCAMLNAMVLAGVSVTMSMAVAVDYTDYHSSTTTYNDFATADGDNRKYILDDNIDLGNNTNTLWGINLLIEGNNKTIFQSFDEGGDWAFTSQTNPAKSIIIQNLGSFTLDSTDPETQKRVYTVTKTGYASNRPNGKSYGAFFLANNSTPSIVTLTVDNVVISDLNAQNGTQAGLIALNAGSTIQNSLFKDNTQSGLITLLYGGTIRDTNDINILNTAFVNNTHSYGYYETTDGYTGLIFSPVLRGNDGGGTNKLSIKDSYFEGNKGTKGGGLIYWNTQNGVEVNNSVFINNGTANASSVSDAQAIGGAIDTTNLSIKDSYFEGNYHKNTWNSSGSIPSYAPVQAGGAISSTLYKDTTSSTVSIDNTDFKDNYVETTKLDALGGAIYLKDAITTITNGSDFTGNYVTSTNGNAYGGAIYQEGGTLTISGSTFGGTGEGQGNSANSTNGYAYGGAIYNKSESGTISADFISNSANGYKSYGGAIYNEGAITSISGSTFANNSVTSENGNVEGGAIYNGSLHTIGDIGADFTNNSASGKGAYGGAIHNYSSTYGTTSIGEITKITNGFKGNSATSTSGNAYGGAIYNSSGFMPDPVFTPSYVSIGNLNTDFTQNHVEATGYAYGGAIYNATSPTYKNYNRVSVGNIDGNFSQNYAYSTGDEALGGAIYSSNATLGTIDGKFTGNCAKSDAGKPAQGGAIFIKNGTVGDITADFEGNYVLTDSMTTNTNATAGGAIIIDNTSNTIGTIKGAFTNNYAKSTVSSSTEDSNGAAGGAIANGSSDLTILSGSSFTGNYVESERNSGNQNSHGGAIYNKGNLSITSTTFSGNYAKGKHNATGDGGAIYNYYQNNTNKIATITGSTFSDNYATDDNNSSNGGAIYQRYGNLILEDTSFTGNKAYEGGAIYGWNANVTAYAKTDDVEFTNNNRTGLAGGDGNGIYILGGSLNLKADTGKTLTVNDNIYSANGMTINADSNGGTVALNGALQQLSGSKVTLNSGTLALGQNALNSFAASSNNLNFVANGGTLDIKNSNIDDATFAKAVDIKGTMNLGIDINLNGTTVEADKITADFTTGNTSAITLSALNFINDNYTGSEEEHNLTIADGTIKSLINETVNPTVTGNTNTYTYSYDQDTGILTLTIATYNNIHEAVADSTKVTRTYKIKSAGGETVEHAIGAIAGATSNLTINGDNKYLDGKVGGVNQGGFIVADGQTLTLKDISSLKNFTTAVDNAGALNVENVTFADNTTDINNTATLNLSGENYIKTITGSTGNTYITGGTTTISQNGSATQKVINISDGELIADYGTTITATEGVKLQGGTLKAQNGATVNNIIADEHYTGNRLVVLGGGFSSLEGTFKGSNTYRALDYNSATALTIDGVTFDSNAAGAIYHSWSGTVDSSISNSTFTNNSNEYDGGAYYQFSTNGSDHTVSFNNVTFTSNSATNKGGAILAGLNAVNKLNISNSTFTSNTVTSANGIGSAIYLQGIAGAENTPSSFTIDNSTFTSNGAGGVVYANGGNLTVKNSTFTSNSGDAIVLADNYQYWTIIGGQITAVYSPITANIVAETGNVAITDNSGWGIVGNKNHETDSALTLYAKSGNITINGNTAGGINNNGLALTLNADTGHNITINNTVSSTTGMTINAGGTHAGTVALNGALTLGDVISVGGGTLELGSTAVTSLNKAISTNSGTVKLTGGTLTQNIAGATTITGTVTDNNATLDNITITNTGNFTDNGGTFTTADNAGTFNVNGVLIATSINNTGTLNFGGTNNNISAITGDSGVTNINSGTLWIEDGSVTQNTINLKGGNLLLSSDSVANANIVADGTTEKSGTLRLNTGSTLTGSISGTFKNNDDTALYQDGGNLTLNNVGFDSNTSSTSAAALLYTGTGSGTITGSQFVNNASLASGNIYGGAAVFGNTGTNTIKNGAFTNNSVISTSGQAWGGAIYEENVALTINGTEFTKNFAGTTSGNAGGGAIDHEGGTLTISGATFGGVDSTDPENPVSLGNSVVSNNGYAYGGAIYQTGGSLSVTDTTFDHNSVTATSGNAYGGAIYNYATSGATINGTFTNNLAKSTGSQAFGGAIANFVSGASISGSFDGNKAESIGNYALGGAIGSTTGLTINDTSFTNNTAVAYNNQNQETSGGLGGAIYVSSGDLIINADTQDVSISGNKASAGGGIYMGDGNVTINAVNKDVTLENNVTAVNGGGAIYMNKTDKAITLNAQDGNIYVRGNGKPGYYSFGIQSNQGDINLNASTGSIVIDDRIYAAKNLNINDGTTGIVEINNIISGATSGHTTNIKGGTLKLGAGAGTSGLGAVTFTNTPTVDLQNGSAQKLYTASVNGSANLNIDIDFTGESVIADSINIYTGGQTGVITLDKIAALSSNEDIRTFENLEILTGQTEGVTLALSTDLQNDTRFNGEAVETLTWESDYSDNATFAQNVFTNTEYSETKRKQLSIVDGTKLSFAESTTIPKHATGNITTQDVLQALNQSTSDGRYLNATETNKNYTVGADLGTTGAGRIEVQGVASSNLNMNSKSGFELSNANTVLYLGQLNITGVKDIEGGLISITGENSYADLSGVTIEDTTNSVILNNGTLNSYSTNNLGTGITGTGTMIVDNGKTTIGSVVQDSVTIDSAWGELEVQNITTTNGITNNGKLTLTGTANANAISGSGKTVIKNALNNTALINQAVEVASTGALTTSTSNLGGTITNAGTLNLSDSLDKAISGTGLTKVNTSLALAEGASVEGKLDLNNGLLNLHDSAIKDYTIGTLKGTGNLSLDIDLAQGKADTLTAGASESGALTITGLNISGTLADFTVDVLKGSTSALTLALSDTLQTQYNTTTAWVDKQSSDTLTQNATWDDTFGSRTWQERVKTTMEIVDNAKIKYTKTVENQNEHGTDGDTLALLNQASQFGAVERQFTTDNANKTHTATADFGTTAAGQLTVKGATEGTNISTINLNGKNGFVVGSGATVALDTVKITGAKAEDGSLINNTAGTVALNNVEVATNANNIITNAATMNLTGTNTINAGINGAGTTNITSGATTLGNIAQTAINVSTGATLNADASIVTVTAALANDGVMNLSGATNANNITGNGTTLFSADMNNSADITQGTVTVASGKTLTNSGTVTITEALTGDAVANNGTLNLNGSNIALNTAISGSGTTNINGKVTNTSGNAIANAIHINGGSLTANANDLDRAVTNSVDNGLVLTGGTLDQNVSGDGATKIAGNVTINEANSLNKVNVASGTLTAKAESLQGAVANSGTVELTGGTLGQVISGGNISVSNNLATNADNLRGTTTVADGKDLTVSGGTIANAISGGNLVIDGNVINNANIASNTTVNSGNALTTAANTIGNVVNNGDLNLTGGSLTSAISGTGTTNINGNVAWGEGAALGNTTIDNGGSLDIGTNNVTLGNTTINGTLKLSITDMAKGSDSYTGGHLNVADLNLGSNSKLSMTVAQGLITEKNATTGAIDLISASGTKSGQFAEMLSNNRYKVTATDDGKFQIAYTASASDIVDEANGTPNNKAAGEAWDTTTPMGGIAGAVQERLNELSQHDAKGYVDALTNLAPTDSMVHVGITQDFNNLIGEQIAARLNREGLNSGDMFERQGAWVQMLYNHSKQDDNSKNQGFTGKTAGVAFGLDGKVDDKLTIGVGYAYGQTDVDSLGRDTDVDGHTIYAYGKYQPSEWYVRGMVNYGFAKYEEKANVSGLMNKSKYDVQNYGARAFVGYDLPNGFTPEVGLRLTHIDRDNYTDSFGQHVKTDGIDVLTASMGVNYSTTVTTKDQKWSPKAHFALTYDLLSDDANATVNVANSVYDIKGEKLNRFGVEAGVGAEISVGNWDFSAEYDLGTRKDYLSHTGMLKAKYNF